MATNLPRSDIEYPLGGDRDRNRVLNHCCRPSLSLTLSDLAVCYSELFRQTAGVYVAEWRGGNARRAGCQPARTSTDEQPTRLSDLAVGYFPGPPPRPPRVLARLHAETARRQALRLAPRHDHLTPFTVNQGLKVRVGAAPLAPPAGHPSHVFPGNRHHFHPQPHCTAVSNHLKIYAVYGKSVGTSPRDYGGQGQVRGPAKRTTALATLDSEKRGARWPSYGKLSGSKPNSSRRC